MRVFSVRVSLILALLIVGQVAAQSLPPCATKCVGKTKTKCKSTDYVCACSDGKYLPRLLKCIETTCDDNSKPQAHGFLSSLCFAVGYPIEKPMAPAGAVLEMLDLASVPPAQSSLVYRALVDRQINSFASTVAPGLPSSLDQSGLGSSSRTRSSSSSQTASSSPASNSASTTRSSSTATATGSSGNGTNNNNDNNNNGGGGLSKGAKIGIGVGVPLGVGLIVGLISLGFFMGRRSKRQQVDGDQTGAAPDMAQPYVAGQTGPAELDPSAQYIGHEMPTQQNTAEMPAGSPPPALAKPAYAWPHQGQPQPGQQHYPPPGQQWPMQQQQEPAELPERMRSPAA